MNGRPDPGSYPPPGYTPPQGFPPQGFAPPLPGYGPPPAMPVATRPALFLQAVRGPILLITIGVLFAIQQAGVMPFTHTWPLILIVIGVMKLLERMAAPPVNAPGGPYR